MSAAEFFEVYGEPVCGLHSPPEPEKLEPMDSWPYGKTMRAGRILEAIQVCRRGGHAFTAENTLWMNGRRCCRACHAVSKASWRRRLAERRAA